MVRKIVRWINYFLTAVLAVLALLVFAKLFQSGGEVSELALQEASERLDQVPKNSFEQTPEAYNAIGSPILTVVFTPPKVELPDLRPYLVYYGVNDRPDIAATATALHFGLKGGDAVGTASPGEKLYLKYDSSKRPGVYVFSSDNQPSALWIEADKDGNKANIRVKMVDEAGQPVVEPATRATFTLTASPYTRLGGGSWEIGKWKVDGTLLARQRARWLGQDLFLNQHGGEEYAEFKDKERIEFGEGAERYSIFVKPGDCLIWDGQRWQNVKLGDSSRGFALMCVTKIDDRVMTLDLWDVGGQGHVTLNLIKSKEAWAPKSLEQDFKFISTRTLSQYVFEIKKDRVVLKPFDWLLLVDKTWTPLTTAEEIDSYVDRKTQGPLYVFVGPSQKDDKQVLKAVLYSPGRTEMSEVVYPLDQPVLGGSFGGETKKAEEQVPPEGQKEQTPDGEPKQEETPVETPSFEQEQTPVEVPASDQEQIPVDSQDQEPIEEPADGNGEPVQQPDGDGQEGVPPRGEQPQAVVRQVQMIQQPVIAEQDQEPELQIKEHQLPHHGEITELIIQPRPKKQPGQLRQDIRFLMQDNE